MKQHGKAGVALLAIVAALGIVMAGVALFFQMKERDLRMSRERELSLVKAEKQDLEQQLTEVRDVNTKIERQLADVKADLEESTRNLADAQKEKDQLAKTAEERQGQIDRMLEDLDRSRTEQRSLTDQLSRVKQEQDGLQKQLGRLRDENTGLEQKVVELSKHPTVELDRVVVNPTTTAPASPAGPNPVSVTGPSPVGQDVSSPSPQPQNAAGINPYAPSAPNGPTEGQVIVVNREYDFIVVNLGSNQGLTLGQEFHVVRGDQVLGRVKVEKLYDELSAAAILPNSNKDAIREGDAVRPI
jgi:hypothetical protein